MAKRITSPSLHPQGLIEITNKSGVLWAVALTDISTEFRKRYDIAIYIKYHIESEIFMKEESKVIWTILCPGSIG